MIKPIDFLKKRDYLYVYTAVFLILAFFCFSYCFLSGRSLILDEDGWSQYLKALVYYAKYLRSIIRHLLYDKKLVIPDWDFHIGEGSDILNALHYYVIGDPIALLSVLVPTKYMHYFYSASCILRLYLAGLSFSALCFGTGIKNRTGVLASAFSYCFCEWGILCASKFPYFLNPLIYFPLMILGIEKIIRKEKPYLFILSAFVSAASNFYFFYIIAVLSVGYTLIRLEMLYKRDVKRVFQTLIRLGLYAAIGVLMAGMIFLPVLVMFLQDSRLVIHQKFYWLYPLSYYSRLPGLVLSNKSTYWLSLGVSAPVVLSVFLLFSQKGKYRLLKVLFFVCAGIALFPIGGRILNGMSYMTNRWCWAFALLCAYILAKEWENLFSFTRQTYHYLVICSVVFFIVCLHFDKSRVSAALAGMSMVFISLIILSFAGGSDHKYRIRSELLLLGIAMMGTINTAFWHFSPGADNYVGRLKENRKIWDEWRDNDAAVMKRIIGDSWSRYTGRSLVENANISYGVSNSQYYWSISNPFVNDYRTQLEMREQDFGRFEGYDDRTAPIALAAVQYYIVRDNNNRGIPYGFAPYSTVDTPSRLDSGLKELREELKVSKLSDAQIEKMRNGLLIKSYEIYENKYPLSTGYFYDSYISSKQWDQLNPVQKQENMLCAAHVEKPIEGISLNESENCDYIIPYEIAFSSNEVQQTASGFVTTENNTKIILNLSEDTSGSEVYVGLEGLEFAATPEYDLYFGEEEVDPQNLYNRTNWKLLTRNRQIAVRKEKEYWDPVTEVYITFQCSTNIKTLGYKQPEFHFSSGRHDFIVNLGYSQDPVSSITITLPERGKYSFDDLRVYCVDMKEYPEKIGQLQEHQLSDIETGIDWISGKADLDRKMILCVVVPYSKGWKGYIDGSESEVFLVNDHYLGMSVPEGEHDIFFRYSTPFKVYGFIISAIGLLLLCAVALYDTHKAANIGLKYFSISGEAISD